MKNYKLTIILALAASTGLCEAKANKSVFESAREYVLSDLVHPAVCAKAGTCSEKKVSVPEKITLKISKDDSGRFIMSSSCRQVRGRFVLSQPGLPESAVTIKIEGTDDKCGGEALSLYHDPAFERFGASVKSVLTDKGLTLFDAQNKSILLKEVADRNVAGS